MSHNSGIVKFTAEWCGPCKKSQPDFEEVRETYSEYPIFFQCFDIDQIDDEEYEKDFHPAVVKHARTIKSLPTFAFFVDGEFKEEYISWKGKNKLIGLIEIHLMTEEVDDPSGWIHGKEQKDDGGELPIPNFNEPDQGGEEEE